jgi:hypothetical protein
MTVQTVKLRLHESRVAFRTNPVAELGFGMVANVSFDLLPVIPIVADLSCNTNKSAAVLGAF